MENSKIKIKNNEKEEANVHDLPRINQKEGEIIFAKSIWSQNISRRTKLPLLNRGYPLIVSLLIITALIMGLKTDLIPSHLAGALILLPSFLAALTKPAELKYFKEERCGDWWKAMISEPILPKVTFMEVFIILFAPLISSFLILNDLPNGDQAFILIVCSITMVLVMFANNAIYSLAENLPRKNATYIPLLTLILIWPYIISSDILLDSTLNEIINEIIIVIIIPCIIFLILPTLSKK